MRMLTKDDGECGCNVKPRGVCVCVLVGVCLSIAEIVKRLWFDMFCHTICIRTDS